MWLIACVKSGLQLSTQFSTEQNKKVKWNDFLEEPPYEAPLNFDWQVFPNLKIIMSQAFPPHLSRASPGIPLSMFTN